MSAIEPDFPARIDHFRLDALVGQGGMGRVYRAFDLELRREVALKMLRDDRPPRAPSATLLREARAAAALRHPNVVTIHEVGELDGTPFLVMEWIDGAPLRRFIGDSGVPLAERLRWLAEIASALSAAHAAGLVHRDVKPENVMVCADRTTRVLDFGLAQRPGDETGATTRDAASPERAARIAGTPRYMAPEQLAGAPLTPAADQYAWAIVAYELCAGAHPGERPPPLHEQNPEVPPALAEVIARAMDERPIARFEDMRAILRALAPLARGADLSTSAPGEAMVREAPPPRLASGDETLPTSPPRASPPAPRHPRRTLFAATGLLALSIALGFALSRGRRSVEDTRAVASASATPALPAIASSAPAADNTASPTAADNTASPTAAAIVNPGSAPARAPRASTGPLASAPPRAAAVSSGACPAGMILNQEGTCRPTCQRRSECGAAAVCLRGACVDCPSGWFSGPGNACFQVCGAGGSCEGKAWPGAECTAWGAQRLCIPPGLQ